MVINNLTLEKGEIQNIPKELRKELLILYNLGLEDYEIEYLIYLRTKQLIKNKWD